MAECNFCLPFPSVEASSPGQGSPLSSLLPSASVPESMTISKYFLSCLQQYRDGLLGLYAMAPGCGLCKMCVSLVMDLKCEPRFTRDAWACALCQGHTSGVKQHWVKGKSSVVQGFRVCLLGGCQLQRNCFSWVSFVALEENHFYMRVPLKDEWKLLVIRFKLFLTSPPRKSIRDIAIEIRFEWLYVIKNEPAVS